MFRVDCVNVWFVVFEGIRNNMKNPVDVGIAAKLHHYRHYCETDGTFNQRADGLEMRHGKIRGKESGNN